MVFGAMIRRTRAGLARVRGVNATATCMNLMCMSFRMAIGVEILIE